MSRAAMWLNTRQLADILRVASQSLTAYLNVVSQVFLPVSIREGAEIPSAPGAIAGAVGGTAFRPRRC